MSISGDEQNLPLFEKPPEPSAFTEVDETLPEGVRSRKRTRNPGKWSRNQMKKRRNAGETYLTAKTKDKPSRMVPGRTIRPVACGGKMKSCSSDCRANFSEEDRTDLFNEYWDLNDNDKQTQYLARCIEVAPTARERLKNPGRRKKYRSVAVKYSFTVHGRKIPCCKKFLVDTLGIGKRKVDYMLQNLSSHGTPKFDERGKHRKGNEIDEIEKTRVRNHIASFDTVESHYCRKDSKRLYLPSDLSISEMYRYYKDAEIAAERTPCKVGLYRYIFNTEFNLAFHKPRKDLCGFCYKFERASAEEKQQLQQAYDDHQFNKERSRMALAKAKENAKNSPLTYHTATFDMEKILTCPDLNLKDLYLTVEI